LQCGAVDTVTRVIALPEFKEFLNLLYTWYFACNNIVLEVRLESRVFKKITNSRDIKIKFLVLLLNKNKDDTSTRE